MPIDPRRVAALRIQLDALAHEARGHDDSELSAALRHARDGLTRSHQILEKRGLYLQLPDDYEPPEGLGGCSGPKSKRDKA